jgi:predicted RNA-binding Zn ribbon-like protein
MRIPRSIAGIELEGGHVALDFVNTVHAWTDTAPRDYWASPADLVAWHQRLGLLSPASADAFAALAPAAGRRLLARARETRHELHALFAGIAATGRAAPAALAWLDGVLARMAPFRHLEPSGAGAAWSVRPDPSRPASLLAPVLYAAAGLVTEADFGRVRACPPPDGCGWLFLDTSRNGRRTWCSMKTCGNAAKVRRFRRRTAGRAGL